MILPNEKAGMYYHKMLPMVTYIGCNIWLAHMNSNVHQYECLRKHTRNSSNVIRLQYNMLVLYLNSSLKLHWCNNNETCGLAMP